MDFKKWVNSISSGFAYLCFNWASMVAPIPSLWAMIDARGWGVGSVMIAIVLEMMGFGAGDSLVRAYHQKTMPRWIANSVFALYVVAVEGVILGYKTVPVWVSDSTAAEMVQATVPVFFPLFTIAGALMASVLMEQIQNEGRKYNKQMARDEIDIEAYRRKKLGDAPLNQSIQNTDSVNESVNQPIKRESEDKILLRFYENNARASQREAADNTGLSQPKISRILKRLESENVIHRNGNGVEILAEL